MPAQNYLATEPGFLRHVEACNRHVPEDYLPWLCDGQQIGLIQRVKLPLLARYPAVFSVGDRDVCLTVPGGVEERTAALQTVSSELAAAGEINFRHEEYRVDTGWNSPLIARLDRGAAVLFGVRGYGIHLNGIVRQAGETLLWVAHRSLNLLVCPGQLDHLVAGGLPAGLTAAETMLKEAAEEAAIPGELAGQSRAVSMLTYCMDRPNGVSRDTIFTFDLELPAAFTPRNTDGEVERFELLPVAEVAEIVRSTDRFKWNCNLVIIDFLIRHGYLDSAHPEYTDLCTGLHRDLA